MKGQFANFHISITELVEAFILIAFIVLALQLLGIPITGENSLTGAVSSGITEMVNYLITIIANFFITIFNVILDTLISGIQSIFKGLFSIEIFP